MGSTPEGWWSGINRVQVHISGRVDHCKGIFDERRGFGLLEPRGESLKVSIYSH